jgi:hypothetical protein
MANDFLDRYEKYVVAKQNKDRLTWLYAIQSRVELQKMAGTPEEEKEVFEIIFKAFVSEQDVEEMFEELCKDSKAFRKDSQ